MKTVVVFSVQIKFHKFWKVWIQFKLIFVLEFLRVHFFCEDRNINDVLFASMIFALIYENLTKAKVQNGDMCPTMKHGFVTSFRN